MAESTWSFEELRERVRSLLVQVDGARLSPDWMDQVAVKVLDTHHPIPGKDRRLDDDLFKKGVVYAIPDEHLELLPSLAKAALAVFLEGPAHGLPELVGLLYRYRTLRIRLEPDEGVVMRALKAASTADQGPLAPADLRDRIAADRMKLTRPVDEVLASLKEKQSGQTILVREANGRWSIGNV